MKASTINKCSSCGAYTVWVVTKNGKSMPIDYCEKAEHNQMFPIKPPMVFDHKTMVSHFATCPDANKFRKK